MDLWSDEKVVVKIFGVITSKILKKDLEATRLGCESSGIVLLTAWPLSSSEKHIRHR